jgi:hypothetical protein
MTAYGPRRQTGHESASHAPGADENKTALLELLADGAARGANWYAPPDDRFADLVARLAVTDLPWLLRCIAWLRRSEAVAPAAIVAAVEMVRALLKTGEASPGGNRQIIALVLRRADEPGAMLGYCLTRYGPKLPKPIQRGIADAAQKLYDEQSVQQFDVPDAILGFADVLKLTHSKPASARQAALFRRLVQEHTSTIRPRLDSAHPVPDPKLAEAFTTAVKTGRVPF